MQSLCYVFFIPTITLNSPFPKKKKMWKSAKPHILIFPFPAQGHMLPLLDLAHQLSLRSISITILITPQNLPILSPLLAAHPTTIQSLILPFPTHQLIPHGVENVKDLPVSSFPAMMFALRNLYDPILNWFNNHHHRSSPPPTAVVYDFFLGWMQGLCRRVGVSGYVFSPSGGFSLSVIYSLWKDKPAIFDDEGENKKKKEIISFPNVPKSPSYPLWQISAIYRKFAENEEDPMCKFIESTFEGNLSSDGVILNAFDEMEGDYLAHLKVVLGHERVWAVGPLLPLDDDDLARERGGSGLVSGEEVCKWLDRCEDRSVVYVCFGSQAVLTNEQIEALTKGLEKSGVRFVLVYKGATRGHVEGEKYGLIPDGFEERVAGRGLLIKGWAPQVSILKHRALGAFLFHCGWNTVLENVLLAGVPMLVWPMIADQYADATSIVDELKIGVRVCEGLETVPDSDELARLLAKAISSELDHERKRSIELHEVALAAIRKGGSSFEELNNLVAHLSK